MNNDWQLTIASDVRNLALISQFVRNAGRAAGLDDAAIFAVELACDEACNNVIEHAYRDASGPLRITCSINQADFIIQIQDQGRPFDPPTARPLQPRRQSADTPVGGLGIHLMRQLMDVVEYRFDEQTGNHLTMIKRQVAPASTTVDT